MDDLMRARISSERGTTLIETMVALTVLLIAMSGLLSLAGMSSHTTENNGHLAARTAEDAQDKMEQLLALKYGDTISDTTVFPAVNVGGTGLAVGGTLDPANPVVGYVDWLATDGSLLGGGVAQPQDWFYVRVWQVTQFSPTIKLISVTVTAKWAFGKAIHPQSTVTAMKAQSF
jgi:type II secretory pathway pseudopilin PulG